MYTRVHIYIYIYIHTHVHIYIYIHVLFEGGPGFQLLQAEAWVLLALTVYLEIYDNATNNIYYCYYHLYDCCYCYYYVL